MKNYFIKRVMLILMLLFAFGTIQAQIKNIPNALRNRLVGKTKLTDIMLQVEDYYAHEGKNERRNEEEDEGESGYQQWKRWEWWMRSHLDENGNFIQNFNKENSNALTSLNNKWGTALQEDAARIPQRTAGINRDATNANQQNRPANVETSYGDWSFIGPTAEGTGPGDLNGLGRIDRIAFHPTNANVIYIGSPTGQLWKTTNGGTSWAVVTDAIGNSGVSGIAVSPANGSVVYILTGDGDSHSPGYYVYDYGASPQCSGVYKSTDDGVSWLKTGNLYTGTSDFNGHHLSISSSNGNYLFAATSQGIYRTTDGGTNWTLVRSGEHWDVKIKPGNDSIVYASSGNQILYSIHGGVAGSWFVASTDFSIAGSTRINLAVSTNNSAYVYALCNSASTGTFTGIFRSVNSGVSYTRRCNSPNILGKLEDGTDAGDQSGYDLGIAVKGSDAEFVATCGMNVWVSNGSNGASSMVWSTKYRESYAGADNKYIHPDVHAIEYNPLNDYLYAGSDGGIYRSTDNGTSWTNLNAGVATTQFYGMAMADADGDGDGDGLAFLAGAQDNGMKLRPNSGSTVFNHLLCCDGYGTAIDGKNTNNLYMNINDNFYKSIDGGATTNFLFTCTFFSPIAIDFTFPDTVYLGGVSTRRSYNGFNTINATISTNTSRVIATCPSNTARLYASAGTNVIRSDDRASSWTTKSGTTGWPAGTFTVNDIEPFPTNSLEIYVSLGGYSNGNKVMRSTNGGDVWVNWSGTLPNVPTYGLTTATEGVYVGTELGVFFRSYTMTDWVPFYNQMPRVPVTELKINNNGFLYAVTFGRGAWLCTRRTACTSLLNLSGERNGAFYYEASNAVNATITAPGSTGTEVFAQAGDSIVLRDGFQMKTGSFFKGYIAPCNNGGVPVTNRSSSGEQQIAVPHLTEIKPSIKSPESTADYFKLTDGNVEICIHKKGMVSMLITDNGTWKPFYPEDILYPGFYALPLPESTETKIKILLNGVQLKELK